MASSDGPPRALLIAAMVLAVGAIGAVLTIAATRRSAQQPVTVATAPAPHAEDPVCRALLTALPPRLGDYTRTDAPTTSAGTAVWRNGDAPVVLQCGLNRPTDFVVGAPIQVVDQVQWFRAGDQESHREAQHSTWYTVDRPVYVALTLPQGSGPTPIQQLSEVIDRTIAAVPIDPIGNSAR